jgi:hypothetical protein
MRGFKGFDRGGHILHGAAHGVLRRVLPGRLSRGRVGHARTARAGEAQRIALRTLRPLVSARHSYPSWSARRSHTASRPRRRPGRCQDSSTDPSVPPSAGSTACSPAAAPGCLSRVWRPVWERQTRGAHARSSASVSGSMPRLRYATSWPVAATGVTATSSYPMRPYGFNVASSSSGTPLSSTT